MGEDHSESICGPCGASPQGTPEHSADPKDPGSPATPKHSAGPQDPGSPATPEHSADPEDPGSPATLRRRRQDPDPGGAKSPEATLRATLETARKTRLALYTGRNVRPAHALRYDWTGWPTAGQTLPPDTAGVGRATARAWEPDGLHLLEAHATAGKVQLLFSATPQVSPVVFCQPAKGRLQHATFTPCSW